VACRTTLGGTPLFLVSHAPSTDCIGLPSIFQSAFPLVFPPLSWFLRRRACSNPGLFFVHFAPPSLIFFLCFIPPVFFSVCKPLPPFTFGASRSPSFLGTLDRSPVFQAFSFLFYRYYLLQPFQPPLDRPQDTPSVPPASQFSSFLRFCWHVDLTPAKAEAPLWFKNLSPPRLILPDTDFWPQINVFASLFYD